MKVTVKRILFPTDFSDDAGNALEFAASLAEQYGAELTLLHVVEDVVVPAYFGAQMAAGYFPAAELEEAAQKELDKLAPQGENGPVTVKRLLRRGAPYVEILATAADEKADLIVMGTHGHSGLAHMLLGSTAERVVRKSLAPVLTIRHPQRSDTAG